MTAMHEAKTQEIIRNNQRYKADHFGGEESKKFQSELREFAETYPLYKRQSIEPPPFKYQFKLEVATLFCAICKGARPFRSETPGHGYCHAASKNSGVRYSPTPNKV